MCEISGGCFDSYIRNWGKWRTDIAHFNQIQVQLTIYFLDAIVATNREAGNRIHFHCLNQYNAAAYTRPKELFCGVFRLILTFQNINTTFFYIFAEKCMPFAEKHYRTSTTTLPPKRTRVHSWSAGPFQKDCTQSHFLCGGLIGPGSVHAR